MKKVILVVLIALTSCRKEEIIETTYLNVKIGEQYWMSLNWDAESYRNGDPIPHVEDSLQWVTARYGAWRYYDDNPINRQKYGKLYNWYAVNDSRNLAPVGWHVPDDDEWVEAIFNNGISLGGFAQMPGGYVGFSTHGLGQYGMWWSRTEDDSLMASGYQVVSSNGEPYQSPFCKINGFSVRLVKD
jgi:hypothetical protein